MYITIVMFFFKFINIFLWAAVKPLMLCIFSIETSSQEHRCCKNLGKWNSSCIALLVQRIEPLTLDFMTYCWITLHNMSCIPYLLSTVASFQIKCTVTLLCAIILLHKVAFLMYLKLLHNDTLLMLCISKSLITSDQIALHHIWDDKVKCITWSFLLQCKKLHCIEQGVTN